MSEINAADYRAFQMLEVHGAPKERARAIANGIDVLATRMQREITELRAALAEAEKDAKRYRWVRSQGALEVHRFMIWAESMPDLDEMIDKAIQSGESEPDAIDAMREGGER